MFIITPQISLRTSLEDIALRFFSNASLVALFTVQHAVHVANARCCVNPCTSSLLFKVAYQAIYAEIVPAKTSPMPPLRFRPPSSAHCIAKSPLEMASTCPFSTIMLFFPLLSPNIEEEEDDNRFISITFGVIIHPS